MEQPQQNNEQSLEPEQAAAKTAILAECDKLAAAGVRFVAAHFDGSGDEGAPEDVMCYDCEVYAHDEFEPVQHDASHM